MLEKEKEINNIIVPSSHPFHGQYSYQPLALGQSVYKKLLCYAKS